MYDENKMNNYLNAKIYKLTSPNTEEIYVGSTCYKYLCDRLGVHKYQYINKPENKNTSSSKLFKLGDVNIELIELYPCNSRKELIQREQYWLETLPNCINKNKAYRSDEYKKDYANYKLICSICSGKFSRCNESNHKKTLLHLNAKLKLEGKDIISSIQCNICNGRYLKKTKNVHDQSKKHLRALKPIDE